jgi:hypothetical protein
MEFLHFENILKTINKFGMNERKINSKKKLNYEEWSNPTPSIIYYLFVVVFIIPRISFIKHDLKKIWRFSSPRS